MFSPKELQRCVLSQHYLFEALFPLRMIGHDLREQLAEAVPVVRMDEVAEFVGDDIVDAGSRRLDEVAREDHVPAIC